MTAINLEEDLELEEHAWRSRIITVFALIAIALGAAGAFLYFRSGDSTAVSRETEEIPVVRSTIDQTLSITGIAEAQLSSELTFRSSGRVSAVNVKVGDQVHAGQVLASLESDDLANAVDVARTNVLSAQLKLDDLLGGADAADLAAADQSVAQAQAALTKAENDYNDMLQGASASDIAVAEQANSLETVLPQIADSLERDTWRRLDLFVRLIEPLMLLLLAGVVLLVVIALLVPVLKMSAGA